MDRNKFVRQVRGWMRGENAFLDGYQMFGANLFASVNPVTGAGSYGGLTGGLFKAWLANWLSNKVIGRQMMLGL